VRLEKKYLVADWSNGAFTDSDEPDNARKNQVRFSKFSLLHSHFVFHHKNIQIRCVPDGREFYVVIKSIGKSGIDGLQVVNIAYFIIIECLTLLTCGKHLHC
jgi:hypothetical protein